MVVLEQSQQAREAFAHAPQDVIAQLFGLEKAVVGIYGNSQDPIVANVARRIFVEKLFDNIKGNLYHAALEAQLHNTADSKKVAERAFKLGKEMGDCTNKDGDIASFLNKKFQEAKVKTKTRAKLIPSFETFNNAVQRLENAHHLLASVPTLDKRAEVAYHLTIYSEWNANRKALLSRMNEAARTQKPIHEVASGSELNFYSLTAMALNIEMNRIKKIIESAKKSQASYSADAINETYGFTTLTDVETEFIVTYLGLTVRYG